MITASTATPLKSPSAEPVVMRALAGTPFCAIAFAEILFNKVPFAEILFAVIFAPTGVTQASNAAMTKGAPMIEPQRKTCDIASPMAESQAIKSPDGDLGRAERLPLSRSLTTISANFLRTLSQREAHQGR
jgi:hypothetical protein